MDIDSQGKIYNSSRSAQLLAQAINDSGLTPNRKERALILLALPALDSLYRFPHVVAVPAKVEKLGPDQILLKNGAIF